jgi:hypothetical protein
MTSSGSTAGDPARKSLTNREGEQLLPIGRFKPGINRRRAPAPH